ncbi:unnamed protein product [Peniophora sp. CBMAI 1063]|nr:unnamed protein product [Peniophora sp. CBMAI 1063]
MAKTGGIRDLPKENCIPKIHIPCYQPIPFKPRPISSSPVRPYQLPSDRRPQTLARLPRERRTNVCRRWSTWAVWNASRDIPMLSTNVPRYSSKPIPPNQFLPRRWSTTPRRPYRPPFLSKKAPYSPLSTSLVWVQCSALAPQLQRQAKARHLQLWFVHRMNTGNTDYTSQQPLLTKNPSHSYNISPARDARPGRPLCLYGPRIRAASS